MTTTAVYHNKEMDLSSGNGSFSEDNVEYGYKKSLKSVYLVIFTLVFLLGVLGNGIVIWVTGFKIKKTVNTIWYLNLAVADFLFTAFLPLTITRVALDRHWPFGKFMCKVDGTVVYMTMYASVYILVVISVDRCVCVVCPVWAQNHRSVRKASWVSLAVWVLGLALSSPYFIFRDTHPSGHDDGIIRCYTNYAPSGDYSIHKAKQLWGFQSGVMIMTRFLVGFVVPFTVIVSCYSVIIYRLRKNRSLAGQSSRSFKIIATVITAFFLCWLPINIMYLIILVTEYSETLYHALTIGIHIAAGLALLNSCLNPLLYVFMGQDFKDVFRSSILKVLEKAFTEELPMSQTETYCMSQSETCTLNVL